MIAKPGHRFAVQIRFADEDFPRFLYVAQSSNVGTRRASPTIPLSACHQHREMADAVMQWCGSPWSLPLAEPPHIVEVDARAELWEQLREMQRATAELEKELADAGL